MQHVPDHFMQCVQYVPVLLSHEAAGEPQLSKRRCCGQIGVEGNGRVFKLPAEVLCVHHNICTQQLLISFSLGTVFLYEQHYLFFFPLILLEEPSNFCCFPSSALPRDSTQHLHSLYCLVMTSS